MMMPPKSKERIRLSRGETADKTTQNGADYSDDDLTRPLGFFPGTMNLARPPASKPRKIQEITPTE
jgi:hypothetical protein